jgi:NitT/TauT family transport system permease protein
MRNKGINKFESAPLLHPRVLFVLSITLGFLIWYLCSKIPGVSSILVGPDKVLKALVDEFLAGRLQKNVGMSLFRVLGGFLIAFVVALPVAFLMGWYKTFRSMVEPWIQFFKTIPPIALIPLVIVAMGIGEKAKLSVIFFTSFLVMVVTIYQGVKNVDFTLIKAAYTFGAKDRNVFFDVIVPASFPYILVAIRLGISTALTTLIASELTGTSVGLGNMIQEASLYFRMDLVLGGIAVIGTIGFTLDKLILYLEKKLTGWQETREN